MSLGAQGHTQEYGGALHREDSATAIRGHGWVLPGGLWKSAASHEMYSFGTSQALRLATLQAQDDLTMGDKMGGKCAPPRFGPWRIIGPGGPCRLFPRHSVREHSGGPA